MEGPWAHTPAMLCARDCQDVFSQNTWGVVRVERDTSHSPAIAAFGGSTEATTSPAPVMRAPVDTTLFVVKNEANPVDELPWRLAVGHAGWVIWVLHSV